MKRKLMPYLLSYAFLFVSYLIISFIMAILFSFMHVSSFIYQLLITFFSYLILVVFTFIFYKIVKEKDSLSYRFMIGCPASARLRTFLITLLAGFIPCSFSLGACHLCGIIRIHISTVRDPVVLAPGSGDPDHITH